jgi:hypothetical protein
MACTWKMRDRGSPEAAELEIEAAALEATETPMATVTLMTMGFLASSKAGELGNGVGCVVIFVLFSIGFGVGTGVTVGTEVTLGTGVGADVRSWTPAKPERNLPPAPGSACSTCN